VQGAREASASAHVDVAAALAWRDVPARVPLKVLDDTIQPFPSFTGIYDAAVEALRMQIADMPWPAGPMAAQMASPSG
jgi:hypothetical protein